MGEVLKPSYGKKASNKVGGGRGGGMQRVNSFRHHGVLTLSKQPVVPMTADKNVADHALRYSFDKSYLSNYHTYGGGHGWKKQCG